ncbi:MAG: copper amine oxidase N-terminal domain-containing protein, partial [Intestinibacillus sp.]
GKDTPVSPYLTKNIVTNADIRVGTRFFAWYDVVALSYPGQTGATRAVLLPAAPDGTEKALQYGEPYPYRFSAEATVTEVRTSTFEGDIQLVPAVTVKTADGKTMVLNLGENTWFVDNATGEVTRWTDVDQQTKILQKGTGVMAFYGAAMTASEPPQVSAEAIVVNRAKGSMPHLLTAENVTMNPDGSVTLLGNNGGSLVTVSADAPVSSVDTEQAVRNTDIRMGAELLAWYDVEAESYPTQAGAEKVVLLPDNDRELTMIAFGDIAIGTAKVENGIVMVPLRLVAETLGFTVTWNGEARSVHLTNGTVQTTVTLGEDSYYKATAIPGAVGLTAGFSLGAPPYEADGRTWVPAELMNLLLGERVLHLHDGILYM